MGYHSGMRLSIDVTRCEGHGRCYELAPEVIRPDDVGHADLVETTGDVGPENEGAVVAAVRNCPERALVLNP